MIQPRLLTMFYSLLAKEPTATEMSLATVYERVSKRLSNVIDNIMRYVNMSMVNTEVKYST
jgi:hypothetical protein